MNHILHPTPHVPRLTPHASRPTHYIPRLTLYIGLLLTCLLFVTTASAQQTISYQDYLSRIGRWREQVRAVQAQDGVNCEQVLGDVADELAAITAVRMPNGATMTVNHEDIVIALRAFPCAPAHADTLLAGICPDQVCPVGIVPLEPNDVDSADNLPLDSPPQLPGMPPPEVVEQLEEQLQAGEPGAGEPASAGSEAEQPAISTTPSESGGGEAGGDEAADDTAETADGGEAPSDASGETADSDGTQTGQEDATTADEGEAGNEAGTSESEGGEEGAAGEATGVGEESSSGENTADSAAGSGQEAAGGGTDGEEAAAATAESSPGTKAEEPAATSQPPEIEPPVESESSPWLWLLVALAIVVIGAGAVLLILSQPDADAAREGQGQAPETAEEAVDEGRELIAAGNYRAAVRHLFLAALLTLDEGNLIQYDKTRTNYELLAAAELQPAIVDNLTPVVETFERVWYGFESVGAAEYEGLVAQIELLKQV